MPVTVVHRDNLCFGAWSNGRRVIIDFPSIEGGTDEGMTPSELIMAALGACIGKQVAEYCGRAGIPYAGMNVRLHWKAEAEPDRIGSIRADVNLPTDKLTLEQETTIMSIVKCGVLPNTLRYSPNLCVTLNTHPSLPARLRPVAEPPVGAHAASEHVMDIEAEPVTKWSRGPTNTENGVRDSSADWWLYAQG